MARKKKPARIGKTVDAFLEQLKRKKLPIAAVYLFGSFAHGKQHVWSDVDLCVVSSQFKNAWTALQYLWRERPPIEDPYAPAIEPVGFSTKEFREGGMLIDEIKRTGIRIK